MISYDTLDVYSFIAVISPALAEEVEIRDSLRLWSLKCMYIYFILVLGSFGKVSVKVMSCLCISYLCFQCVYYKERLGLL